MQNNSNSSQESETDPEITVIEPERTTEPGEKSTSQAIAKLEADLASAKADFLYLRAEFDNYRKNSIKERSDLTKYGAERLAQALLQVLDIFETALTSEVTPENFKSFHKGIQMTATELQKALSGQGILPLDALGLPFDPLIHEAIGAEDSDSVAAGHILRVLRKAYKIHDKVLRPAQVIVAQEPRKN